MYPYLPELFNQQFIYKLLSVFILDSSALVAGIEALTTCRMRIEGVIIAIIIMFDETVGATLPEGMLKEATRTVPSNSILSLT